MKQPLLILVLCAVLQSVEAENISIPDCIVPNTPKIALQVIRGPITIRDKDGQSLLWLGDDGWFSVKDAAPIHLIQLQNYSVMVYDDDGCIHLIVPSKQALGTAAQ